MKKLISVLLTGIFILSASFNASAESVKLSEDQLNHFQQISFVDHEQFKLTLLNQADINGQRLILYKESHNDFLFIPAELRDGDQYYYIAEKLTGRIVTVADFSPDNGKRIVIYNFTGGDNQKFKLTGDARTGKYKIVAKFSGRAITVLNQNFQSGNDVIQWDVAGANNVMLIQSQKIPARPTKLLQTQAEAAPALTSFAEPTVDAPWHVVGQTYIPYFLITPYQNWETPSYRVQHTPYYLLTHSVGHVRNGVYLHNDNNSTQGTNSYENTIGVQSTNSTAMSSKITQSARLSLSGAGVSAEASVARELGLENSSTNTNYSQRKETIPSIVVPAYTAIQVYTGAIKYDLYSNNVTPDGSNALDTWIIKKPNSSTTRSYHQQPAPPVP